MIAQHWERIRQLHSIDKESKYDSNVIIQTNTLHCLNIENVVSLKN